MRIPANGPDSLIWWDWVERNRDDIWDRTVEHVSLTWWSMFYGVLIAAVLAAVSIRYRWTFTPISMVSGLLYTIPSLALFTFLLPYTHLGFRTTQIGLVSYTLFILVRNFVAGIDGVPAEVVEAADGMGLTPFQRLVQVQLRLATPAIIAGLRVATVTVIGLVTVGSLVGAGGYGVFILDGMDRDFKTPMVVGGGLSLLLALVVDVGLAAFGRLVTPWARRRAPV